MPSRSIRVLSIGMTPWSLYRVEGSFWSSSSRRWLRAPASHSESVRNRLRQDWSVVWANSRLIPSTVLRSATISPVRYSAKCRRWHSLPKRSPYWARASCTTWGNSTIPGMSRCSILHLRQAENGQNPFHLPHFYTVGREFAKDQSELAFGKIVKVMPRATDRYGRIVGDVVLPDGRVLNEELVRVGLAWWYRQHAPNIGTLPQLEAGVRAAKRGL